MADICDSEHLGEKVLSIPRLEYLKIIRRALLTKRGRLAVTMDQRPDIMILARVMYSFYLEKEECVVIAVSLYGGAPPLMLFFYLEDIRHYHLFGLFKLVHEVSDLESGNDCPSKVRFLD